MPDRTRVDYEVLAQAASQFEKEAQRIRQTTQTLTRGAQALEQDWAGRGAEAFRREMESEIGPALKRLEQGLAEGGRVLKALSRLFEDAETEAAGYLKLNAEGGAGDSEGGAEGGAGEGGGPKVAWVPPPGGEPGPDASADVKARWNELTPDQKKQALQNISDEQLRQAGGQPVPVSFEKLKGEYGYYKDGQIHIDEGTLNDPSQALNTIAHESRHAFQQQMADRVSAEEPGWGEKILRAVNLSKGPDLPQGVTEDQARSWKNNFADYKAAPEAVNPNFSKEYAKYLKKNSAYLNQPVEKDAIATGDGFVKGLTRDKLNTYVPPAPAQP